MPAVPVSEMGEAKIIEIPPENTGWPTLLVINV